MSFLPTTRHLFLRSDLLLHHHKTFPSIFTLFVESDLLSRHPATMVVTRSSLDTARALPWTASRSSRKTKILTIPLSSTQLGQKHKSTSDPSTAEEPARKKHAVENRFATARSGNVAPLNRKRKSGDNNSFPSDDHSTGFVRDFESSSSKKLKVAGPAAEDTSGRKLLSPGPTLLAMPREIRDMILGYIFGNRTLHIGQGNSWSKSINIYQVRNPFACH